MKLRILAAFAFLAFAACKKEEAGRKIEAAAPEAAAMIKGKLCYEMIKNRDTVRMSVAMNANNANGTLEYNLSEKDRNTGTISGTFIGDTLYADYRFNSEGQTSVREVVFLKTGDVLTEGHGEMEEKDNKICFKNPKKVVFDHNGIILVKTKCD